MFKTDLSFPSADPPSFVYGVYPDLGMLDPISDPAIPLNDKPAAFTSWASGYYAPISSTSHITPDALCNRTEEGTPTVHALSSTDFTRIVQSDVVFRSGGLILQTSPEIHARHTRCAFLDADAVLPDVEIVALWCDRSMWMTVWGARALEELLREEPGAGKRKRPTSLVKLENANHFVSNPYAHGALESKWSVSLIGTSQRRLCKFCATLYSPDQASRLQVTLTPQAPNYRGPL